MSKTEILEALSRLTPEERDEVRAKLDELTFGSDGWAENCGLSEADKRELEADLAEYERSPNEGSSWEEVEARIRAKLRL